MHYFDRDASAYIQTLAEHHKGIKVEYVKDRDSAMISRMLSPK